MSDNFIIERGSGSRGWLLSTLGASPYSETKNVIFISDRNWDEFMEWVQNINDNVVIPLKERRT